MNFELIAMNLAQAAADKTDILLVLVPEAFKPGRDALSKLVADAIKSGELETKSGKLLPAWRVDDVMISYAADGGGVGPHFDSYDVFLLQAHGQRRWRIGRHARRTARSALLTELAAATLKDFYRKHKVKFLRVSYQYYQALKKGPE